MKIKTLLKSIVILSAVFMNAAYAEKSVVVDGKIYNKDYLDALKRQHPNLRDDAIVGLAVQLHIFGQEAVKLRVDRSKEFSAQKDVVNQELLYNSYLSEQFKKFTPPDSEVEVEYNNIKDQIGDKEFLIRQILLKSEDEAKEIIRRLEKGEDFSKLANEKSIDAYTNKNGGLINSWGNKQSFPLEFYNVIKSLQKWKYVLSPIQTNLGWHIVYLEDVRPLNLPPLEKYKSNVLIRLFNKQMDKSLQELKGKAKITVKSE